MRCYAPECEESRLYLLRLVRSEDAGFWLDRKGMVLSIADPAAYRLLDMPFIYLVPQWKVKRILLLGVAGATVKELYTRLFGEAEWTLVDIDQGNEPFIQMDAHDFIGRYSGPKFDYVIVDIFDDDKAHESTFTPKFSEDLAKICDNFSINMHRKQSSLFMFKKWKKCREYRAKNNLIIHYGKSHWKE